MYLIVVKFPVKPEFAEQWRDIVNEYTLATESEAGNLWFEWSRSIKDPNEYVLVEGFSDDGAEPHVRSEHFAAMRKELPRYLSATPKIISRKVDGEGWDEMAELQVE